MAIIASYLKIRTYYFDLVGTLLYFTLAYLRDGILSQGKRIDDTE